MRIRPIFTQTLVPATQTILIRPTSAKRLSQTPPPLRAGIRLQQFPRSLLLEFAAGANLQRDFFRPKKSMDAKDGTSPRLNFSRLLNFGVRCNRGVHRLSGRRHLTHHFCVSVHEFSNFRRLYDVFMSCDPGFYSGARRNFTVQSVGLRAGGEVPSERWWH